MKTITEYIANRMAQCKEQEKPYFATQLRRWKFLSKLHHYIPVTREEKMDFIRDSLEAYRISNTTIDIMVRKMIRVTLPAWVAVEFNSSIPPLGYEHEIFHSINTPGLSYETSIRGCDCPGFRGSQHCHHHDDFVAIHGNIPSSMDENLTEEDYRAAQEVFEKNEDAPDMPGVQ